MRSHARLVGAIGACVLAETYAGEFLMTAATIPGLDTAPTKHKGLLAWVQEVAELTQPDRVAFADGSEEEFERLATHLVEAGTFKRLNDDKLPNSYLALSDPSDVAPVG